MCSVLDARRSRYDVHALRACERERCALTRMRTCVHMHFFFFQTKGGVNEPKVGVNEVSKGGVNFVKGGVRFTPFTPLE